MGRNYIFTLDNKGSFRSELKNYVTERFSLIGLPYMQTQVEKYVNTEIIDRGINRSTELVSWVYSKEGLGFLGWKKDYAEEQIEKMKAEIKRSTIVFTKKLDIEFKTSNSDYLEVVLRAEKQRTHYKFSESGDFIESNDYTFLEHWYEWITKGYVGNRGYKVFYKEGRGESGVASMIDDKNPSRWSIAKDNKIVRKRNPALESFDNNKDKTTKAFRRILELGIKKSFK